MSRREPHVLLQDMYEAIRRIEQYIAGMSWEQFAEDAKTQDAVIRNLEVIGEAVKLLPETFRERHPELPWKAMAGLRDRLIHQYFGVNLDIIWHIVTQELPGVKAQILQLLRRQP